MLPLSIQLEATARVVAFVISGRSLNDVLSDHRVIEQHLRPGVQALSFVVLRHLGAARFLIKLLAKRTPPPEAHALLCTVLALLVCESDAGATYSSFTLVNQAVEAAKASSKTQANAGFINAVLRQFLRHQATFMSRLMQDEEARYNHPKWWIKQLKLDHPSQWETILAANQIKPPLSLRINLMHTTRRIFSDVLTERGIAHHIPDDRKANCGLVLANSVPVQTLPKYDQGWFSVQDIAAQAATLQLLSVDFLRELIERMKRGEKVRILDACAAPGGKTTHLIERVICALQEAKLDIQSLQQAKYFEVVAIDQDEARLERIHLNLERLGLKSFAVVKHADAVDLNSWWDGDLFDAVLLDAPCTASGIVRRHPDIRWLRRASDLTDLQQQQCVLLQTLWAVLKPKGRLLYATCSVFQAEGAGVVTSFLNIERQAQKLTSHGAWLPTTSRTSHDGFYDALFEKKPL